MSANPREIELKVLEIDEQKVIHDLTALGAQKHFDSDITSLGLDFSDYRLTKADKLLRLRSRTGKNLLTYKRLISKLKSKISEEVEVNVDDFEKAVLIFKELGLYPKKGQPTIKHRLAYSLNGSSFEIDTIPGLPTYLEIESPSEEQLYEYIRVLDLPEENVKAWGDKQVRQYYASLDNDV